MANVEYSWPNRDKANVVGKDHTRLDGIEKSTGAAKYTYDVNLDNQLIAVALGCPYGHCQIKAIDVKQAANSPGVVHVKVFEPIGREVHWEGELLAVVAAESEGAAVAALAKIKVLYDKLDVFTDDEDLAAAKAAERTASAGGKIVTQREPGDDDDEDEFVDAEMARLFKNSAHVVEGYYGIDVISHCCMEPHGVTVMWKDGKMLAYLSTQWVAGNADILGKPFDLTADDVEVRCEHIGGGFGSKFPADYWTLAACEISKATGRPVKFMLTRDQELKIAGNRPSGYIKAKLGADKDGKVTVWDSEHWGTSGMTGSGVSHKQIPYVLVPPNYRRKATKIRINGGAQRAWRAPNHPQGCAMSQTAYDDLAAKMGADSYDIFMKNIHLAQGAPPEVYIEEMKIAAKMMDWKAKWHPHGRGESKGSVREGLGMALHTWGGGANASTCQLRVHPDGGVESFCATQDLGTGTRTVCAQVLAETFGLKVQDVRVNIGSSKYPVSGASGGSTTVGAVSESHRRAAQDALAMINEKVAAKLQCKPTDLEAVNGRLQVVGNPDKSLSWKQACGLLGLGSLEVSASYKRGAESPLSSKTVGGVQMAHVEVDVETGVVKVRKFVAVQDIGMVMNPLLARSQVYGSVIMGITYALFEQRILDSQTGAFINAEMSNYRLPRVGDIGDIDVHFYEPESERKRGVVGIGEPPVISPGAAVSNAVCNALGVRVPVLPMTPKRVLEALQKAGRI